LWELVSVCVVLVHDDAVAHAQRVPLEGDHERAVSTAAPAGADVAVAAAGRRPRPPGVRGSSAPWHGRHNHQFGRATLDPSSRRKRRQRLQRRSTPSAGSYGTTRVRTSMGSSTIAPWPPSGPP
jgi:hypothetical protein